MSTDKRERYMEEITDTWDNLKRLDPNLPNTLIGRYMEGFIYDTGFEGYSDEDLQGISTFLADMLMFGKYE